VTGNHGNNHCKHKRTSQIHVEKIHEFSLQQPLGQRPFETQREPNQPDQPNMDEIKNYRKTRRKMIIPKIIGKFKMQASKQINILHQTIGKKIWQPDYHDRVIRNDQEFYRIKHYIVNNPMNWVNDRVTLPGLWM